MRRWLMFKDIQPGKLYKALSSFRVDTELREDWKAEKWVNQDGLFMYVSTYNILPQNYVHSRVWGMILLSDRLIYTSPVFDLDFLNHHIYGVFGEIEWQNQK